MPNNSGPVSGRISGKCPVRYPPGHYLKIIILDNWIPILEKVYVHQKIEFVTVNPNSLNYGGGKLVFHSSVVKACFAFRFEDNVRVNFVLSGRKEIFVTGAPLVLNIDAIT